MIYIGTSGWSYADWRGRFYPSGVPSAQWLAYYASHFDTVELNATTYRLPATEQVEAWCAAVPPHFRFTVKLSRLITHRKTITPNLDRFIANYAERISGFVPEKLAQILCQFPPYLERDDRHLSAFLQKLPAAFRYVVEFRHKSWLVPEVAAILREHDVAFCIHDYPGCHTADVITSDQFSYVRFHGYKSLYRGNYPRAVLLAWARRIKTLAEKTREVFVYFNNDYDAAAIADAKALREVLA